MRQLVSVVTEQTVSYYLAAEDSEHVHQVAQIVNTGLEVGDVIDLGANLLTALRLNGKGAKALIAPTARTLSQPIPVQPALTPAEPPAKSGQKSGQKSASGKSGQPRMSWGLRKDAVLADVRAHPDTTYREIAKRLIGTEDPRAISTVAAHCVALREGGHRFETRYERVLLEGRGPGGRNVGVKIAHIRLREHGAPEPAA